MKVDHSAKDEAYNRNMQRQMGWAHLSHLDPYEYHWDRGLYYHEIVPNLLCGTQPRHAADVDALVSAEGITHILNLQQEKDMHYWGVKLEDIRKACARHSVTHLRRPAKDFDPHSLRKTIPGAIHTLTQALNSGGRVYVHCTAGLGRAPAVCIAYLYWFCDMQLEEAYSFLTAIRPCGPKRDAIRGATYDVLAGSTVNASGNGHPHGGHGHNGHGHGHGHGAPNGGGGDFAAFDSLPPEAFATLSEDDRFALQYRILKGLC
ncbi:hypothetical protein GPECTOR_8g350 [Gonium pectorale]|uniref:Tyrosine specific protein phosphatases domain-containing protein n=1 Tax=Gonium pectorale TaxID=33097 RepID=A0A150GSZ0_GONPE|nr:hypothetical protein GPECTOR_8g350 [Gonium pectorale]|eukprot:KXZ52979.1 hypothetical protein GPECTOR_8g350 [Gonium pectorale]